MAYYAHSGLKQDKSDWQPLSEHLVAVAELAAEMARPLGLERAAFIAGLFHDLGKYSVPFQRYIEGAGQSVDHSTAGAVAMLGDLVRGPDKAVAQVIAYCIAGHHAGLPDWKNGTGACLDRRAKESLPMLDPIWQTEIVAEVRDLLPTKLMSNLSRDRQRAAFQLSVIGRMIFSALVDADFKDTERFYAALDGHHPDRDWARLQALLPQFIAAFDSYMNERGQADNALNRLRGDILAHVRAGAAQKPGLFTLTVPTGGGKTLTTLGFALDHARIHGHSRIIYAIPFTSIIDQTATIFAEILGSGNILEHHSAIDDGKLDRERDWKSRDKLKLAMEDWAAPVVVTTNVQLFESLFAAKTSRARKVHNIANSVIILDEAQTIPRHLLKPVMRMLEELALNYGCTIVLCTATQPALNENKLKDGLPLEGRELAPNPEVLATQLRRAHIRRAGPLEDVDLIEAVSSEKQALVIVNSRGHALELFRLAQEAGLEGAIHLTTRQCAAHRRTVLQDVRDRLRRGALCRLIATSLIEAGVDVDFPKVWRAEAGLDSIIQAAGRCNREGKRPLEESIVTVFSTPGRSAPAEIRGLVTDMQRMLDRHDDLLSLPAIEDYFGEVYWRMGDRLDGREKLKAILPRFVLTGQGADFAYRSVAQDFRMIESEMVPVICAFDEESKKVVGELGIEGIPSGLLARKLQPYAVSVPAKARELLIHNGNGHVVFERPDLRGDQFAVLQTASLYRQDVGLLWEDADYLGVEQLIIS